MEKTAKKKYLNSQPASLEWKKGISFIQQSGVSASHGAV